MRFVSVSILAALMLAGCAQPCDCPVVDTPEHAAKAPEPELTLTPVRFADLLGWQADQQAEALAAYRRSCERWARIDPDTPMRGTAGMGIALGDFAAPCADLDAFAGADDEAARQFFEMWFRPFAVRFGAESIGLFTGYYEPELQAALQPDIRFRYPLYQRPTDLIALDLGQFRADLAGERIVGRVEAAGFVPYHDRGAIMDGALDGRGLEFAWVDDPVEAFFLQIQGSGRLALRDGRAVRVGYAGKNGRPYASIGRALVQRGEMTIHEASAQRIKDWVRAHPDQARDLLATNESFVFFEMRADDGLGPIGAKGAPLTAGRSIAVDRAHIPLGAPLWLDAPYADAPAAAPGGSLRRLMIAQDVGGAIKGPIRGDFFWGSGPEAGIYAGRMKSRGRYFFLAPLALAQRLAPAS